MHTITDHEFLQNDDGALALVLDVLSCMDAQGPVLLVSRHNDTAYLRRAARGYVEQTELFSYGGMGER